MTREDLRKHCEQMMKVFERAPERGPYQEHKMVIDLLNQTEWIPVSEDLPEDIKPVQITWKNNDLGTYYQDIKGKHFTGTAHYKDGKWYWYSDVTEDFLAEYGRCDIYEFDSAIEVVAWMSMAEPYETESEIEE